MNKRNFYIIGALVVVMVLFVTGYRADQPVQPEPTMEWQGMIAERGLARERFFVQNSNVELEAEIVRAENAADDQPAVLFIPGSGSTTYQAYAPGVIERWVLDVFIPRDYAVVFVNKRGMGESGGNWMHNDFQGRAEDVLAVVKHIRQLEGVDPDKIGLIGHSQGGWVANLAASQDPSIAFFISLAGPVTTVQEQMTDIYENDFRCQGLEGEALVKRVDRQLNLARLGASIGRVVRVGVIGFDAGIIDYDPQDAILSTVKPGLFIFGENDPYVPADHNLERFDELFPGGSANLTIIPVEQGDHHFRVIQSPCQPYAERLEEPFSDALFDDINSWLDDWGF